MGCNRIQLTKTLIYVRAKAPYLHLHIRYAPNSETTPLAYWMKKNRLVLESINRNTKCTNALKMCVRINHNSPTYEFTVLLLLWFL